ncbi:MAG: polymer-forming cytoskeletal protein [Dehalococcoidales bacterium]|nr:polymer-forming cytoskeletal protein [Dehalococcoidales bacterium]
MVVKIKTWLHKIFSSERGDTLILALIVMILVGFLIGPLLNHMSTGLKNSREVYSSRTDEQYAADAGVSQAMWYIKYRGEDVPEEFIIDQINGKTVFVNIEQATGEDESISYTIISRAGSTTTTAITGYTPEIEAVPGVPGEESVCYFNNCVAANSGDINVTGAAKICSNNGNNGNVFSGGDVVIEGSSSIEGDVYAVGDVELAYSTRIDGNAVASGSVNTIGTVTGTRTSYADLQSAPGIDGDDLDEMVQSVYDGTFNLDPLIPGGATYGGITVKNQSGTHYPELNITGNLEFRNTNTGIVFDSQVYVAGNIYFRSGTQDITFCGPVYAGGKIYVGSGSGTISFNSRVIANEIDLSGCYTFLFNSSVKDLGDLSVGNSINTSFASTIYVDGDFEYSGASNLSLNDNIYIKGALTLGNSTQLVGPEKVVVRGNVTLSGATVLTADQLPFLIMPPAATTPALASSVDPSTFTLANSAIASAVVYAPTADFSITGSAKLYGGIICQSADVSNSAIVEYLTGISARDDLYSPGSEGTPGIEGSPESWRLNTWNID